MLSVYTDKGYRPINNRSNFNIVYDYEGGQTLSFDIPTNDEIYRFLYEENLLHYGDNEFKINKINQRKIKSTVTAVLNLDDWKKRLFQNFHETYALFNEIINLIIPDEWAIESAGTVTGRRTINLEGATPYDILMQCISTYNIVFEYHVLKKTIKVIKPDTYQSRGLYITDELNLKELEFKGDSSTFATRLYAFGKKTEETDEEGNVTSKTYVDFAEINGGRTYVDNNEYSNKLIVCYWQDDRYTNPEELLNDAIDKLKELSKPSRSYSCKLIDLSRINEKYRCLDFKLYDKVTLIDSVSKVHVQHQIVEYVDYPDNRNNNSVSLSSTFKKITGTIDNIKQSISSIDTNVRRTETSVNEIIRDVKSNTLKIENTYTKGETDNKITTLIQQSTESIDLSIQNIEKKIYKFETGSRNIFDNCNQFITKESSSTEKVQFSDMPLGINKNELKGKDICISVDVDVVKGVIDDLKGYIGAEFSVTYADGEIRLYSARWYLGQFMLQYLLQTSTLDVSDRIWMHYKLEDKDVTIVSNLKIVIDLNAEYAAVSYPKVEFGTYPTGFSFDIDYVRDNIVTLNRNYTQIVQNIDSLSLKATSLTEEITTIKGDVSTVEKRLQSTELKLTPTEITAMVNEKIGADGTLYTTKFILDKNGVHISGGGLDIKNNAGTKVFYADTDGNLIIKNLTAENGTFSGTVKSSTITGSTIKGNTITGGTIDGATITSGTSATAVSISGGRFNLKYGSTNVGYIGTNIFNNTDCKGLVFDLEDDGAYMSWGYSNGTSYVVKLLYASKAFSDYTANRLYLGCDLDMRNHTLRNVAFEDGGITGTLNFVKVVAMDSDGTAHTWTNNCKMEFKNGILVAGTW